MNMQLPRFLKLSAKQCGIVIVVVLIGAAGLRWHSKRELDRPTEEREISEEIERGMKLDQLQREERFDFEGGYELDESQ